MKHPWWYYDYYDHVFSRGEQYRREVDLLASALRGVSGTVCEVGAGTGNHAAELLTRSPDQLVLVDSDPVAVERLRTRFANESRIRVRLADGFDESRARWCDRIFAMYSLVQQTDDSSMARSRVVSLVRQIRQGGFLAFEMIDAAVSRSVYPPNRPTQVYNGSDGWLSVVSSYSADSFRIAYTGELLGRPCAYACDLVSVTPQQAVRFAQEAGVTAIRVIPMDKHGRRMLVAGHVHLQPN